MHTVSEKITKISRKYKEKLEGNSGNLAAKFYDTNNEFRFISTKLVNLTLVTQLVNLY